MNGVVITGPTGAIGMALIKKCIEDGRNVLAICHRGSKRIKQIPNSEFVKIVEASLDEYCNLFVENKLSIRRSTNTNLWIKITKIHSRRY